MKYIDLLAPAPLELKGVGEGVNEGAISGARRKKTVCVSKHHGFARDEHDRFMPMYFNSIHMPLNINIKE